MKASSWLHSGTNPLLATWSTEFFRSPDSIINIRQQHKGELGVCGSEGYLFIIFLSSESFQLPFPGSRLGDRSFRGGGSARSPEHGDAQGDRATPGSASSQGLCARLSVRPSVRLSVCLPQSPPFPPQLEPECGDRDRGQSHWQKHGMRQDGGPGLGVPS